MASVELTFAVTASADGTARLDVEPEVLPIRTGLWLEPRTERTWSRGTEPIDLQVFVEDRVVAFLATYLTLLRAPAYRLDNRMIDPVCGMTVDEFNAPVERIHDAHVYVFCSPACAQRFATDTESWILRSASQLGKTSSEARTHAGRRLDLDRAVSRANTICVADLGPRFRALIEAHREALALQRNAIEAEMSRLETERAAFLTRVKPLFVEVVVPRLQALADTFGLDLCLDAGGAGAVISFDTARRIPATVELVVRLDPGEAGSEAQLIFAPKIRPMLVAFAAREVFPLPNPADDREAAGAFLDDRILRFARGYAELGDAPALRTQVVEVDPVCGMEINRVTGALAHTYAGESYYFCAPTCRDRFVADPERYSKKERS